MNMKLTKGLLGLGALLIASQVNAATVSLTPASNDIAVGDTVTLTVQGSEFVNGVSAGTVAINWDTASVQLNSTLSDIQTSLFLNGFDAVLTIDNSVAGQLLVTAGQLFSAPIFGPGFDFFSLDFLSTLSLGSSLINISAGPGGDWQDAFFNVQPVADYVGATLSVNAVPVPAAAWLFGSGLIGLIGIARRKA